MRKSTLISLLAAMAVSACGSHDPILPGTRAPIFDAGTIRVQDIEIPNAPQDAPARDTVDCPYTQDTSNIIWHGDKKIFTGFPTSNCVKSNQQPVCTSQHLYVGLTTGEVVKINRKTRDVVWVADIFRATNITGGSPVLDIVAPIIVDGSSVYVGGLGDAVCRLRAATGAKVWCAPIATALPMVVAGPAVYVMATDGYLYALDVKTGDAFWRTAIKRPGTPVLANGVVTVGAQSVDAARGVLVVD